MIQKCANKIAKWLIDHGAVENEDFELYSYAAYSFLLSIAPLVMAICFGLFMGQVVGSIIFILPFMVIRKFSGGYHAKRAWICILCSGALLYTCLYIAKHAAYNISFVIVTIISSISLVAFSPVDSDNRRIDLAERIKYKRITAYFTGMFLVGVLGLSLLKKLWYARCVSMGIILAAGLQIPCICEKILKRIHQ